MKDNDDVEAKEEIKIEEENIIKIDTIHIEKEMTKSKMADLKFDKFEKEMDDFVKIFDSMKQLKEQYLFLYFKLTFRKRKKFR